MKVLDLSHSVNNENSVYPGLPGPVVGVHLSHDQSGRSYAPGTSFEISHISMVGNAGTYLNAPSHRFKDAPDISAYNIEQLVNLRGIVVDASGAGAGGSITEALLKEYDISGKAVLFYTGESEYWGKPRYAVQRHYLTHKAAEFCLSHGVQLVGIDNKNIDNECDPKRPVHTVFLRNGIPEVANLCRLEQLLSSKEFRFFAVPPRIVGMSAFPTRAFAIVSSS